MDEPGDIFMRVPIKGGTYFVRYVRDGTTPGIFVVNDGKHNYSLMRSYFIKVGNADSNLFKLVNI